MNRLNTIEVSDATFPSAREHAGERIAARRSGHQPLMNASNSSLTLSL